MNGTSQQVLDSFERLPEVEKQQVAIEILRRTLSVEVPPLSEETLTLSAEAVFLSLDEAESEP
ncbi:MAG: hypothetical protein KME11_19360 [Timaviella obliquedivisa GSE-PSE-MK23-08B]|jgi:hypothetical protein|nr:hypothetical protein [Timaviella obliquedivisa GSE-PSE-MK23-08B]